MLGYISVISVRVSRGKHYEKISGDPVGGKKLRQVRRGNYSKIAVRSGGTGGNFSTSEKEKIAMEIRPNNV